ncbi:FecR domain-containing protein, partial [Salmonella enterica]|nr:FecR domain-containing protein [Salmonella enterica]
RPFLVRTRHGTVRALGTRYSVRDDDDTSRVEVFEGAVEIRPADAPGVGVRLDAGQGSRFTRDRVDSPVTVAQDAAAWSR